jgi:uncharacterized protein (TIGR02147 family)
VKRAKAQRSQKTAQALETDRQITALQERRPNYVELSTEAHRLVSTWYIFAIYHLIVPGQASIDPVEVARRFHRPVTAEQVREALTLLEQFGLIRRIGESTWASTHDTGIVSSMNVPSKSIRTYHRDILKSAEAALEEQDLATRHFLSLLVRIDKAKLPEAKKTLREFLDKFNQVYYSESGKSVYQLGLQFFELIR